MEIGSIWERLISEHIRRISFRNWQAGEPSVISVMIRSFIYTFDSEGKVIEIVPIQLTKIGNLNWTEEDIKKIKTRTIGRSILSPFTFDPNVDSVSGATITAVLIFDSLDKAKTNLRETKEGRICIKITQSLIPPPSISHSYSTWPILHDCLSFLLLLLMRGNSRHFFLDNINSYFIIVLIYERHDDHKAQGDRVKGNPPTPGYFKTS